MIDYLLGVLSPATLMTGAYIAYREKPEDFHVLKSGDIIEYSFRNRDDAFLSAFTFLARESPPWLLGFRMKNPGTGQTTELLFQPPEHVPGIPAGFAAPPADVEFNEGVIPWQRELIPYI